MEEWEDSPMRFQIFKKQTKQTIPVYDIWSAHLQTHLEFIIEVDICHEVYHRRCLAVEPDAGLECFCGDPQGSLDHQCPTTVQNTTSNYSKM